VTVSWHGPMTTRNISSTMYLIMCLLDLPLAIFQCYQQDRRSTARIIDYLLEVGTNWWYGLTEYRVHFNSFRVREILFVFDWVQRMLGWWQCSLLNGKLTSTPDGAVSAMTFSCKNFMKRCLWSNTVFTCTWKLYISHFLIAPTWLCNYISQPVIPLANRQ